MRARMMRALGRLNVPACGLLFLSASLASAAAGGPPEPSPQMQRLLRTLSGTWAITYTIDSGDRSPNGGTGQGKEVYRPGPGGASLIEEFHSREGTTEVSGLGLAWWDEQAQGYRAVWCDNSNPGGCGVMAHPAHFEGNDFVLTDEFEMMGDRKSVV